LLQRQLKRVKAERQFFCCPVVHMHTFISAYSSSSFLQLCVTSAIFIRNVWLIRTNVKRVVLCVNTTYETGTDPSNTCAN